MLNLFMIYQENVAIVKSKSIVQKEKRNLGENFDLILKNIG